MLKKLSAFFSKEYAILSVYVLASIGIALQHYRGGPDKYNNFVIFRSSVLHLLHHQNLHLEYPDEYFDLFLYHPSFCILFSPFAFLPVSVSIVLWAIACSLAVFYAIKCLPVSYKSKCFLWWFILVELTTSLHSQQTNPLIAALGLFTFTFLEKQKPKWAALFPILAFCIKGYGLIFAAMFIFYPKKGQYILYSLIWLLVLTILPFPITGTGHFVQVYQDWFDILLADHKNNFGFSVMGLFKVWNPNLTDADVTRIQLAGLLLLATTWTLNLIKNTFADESRRMLLLAYLFLWVILFNHASESPTYVIAVTGAALFYIVNRDFVKPWPTVLIVLVLFFSMLAPTDVYPPSWRNEFFKPYLIKVIPCLLVWAVVQFELLFIYEKQPALSSTQY
ncbi:glycosyltransferase family 87 protein [Dyadobacter pollutisoli]|uniref:Glycosyltransferase family 87 protein n=1 Tax=Dyadobacter pollutisoli TaxID=2910158 RepID=A0A9E8NDK8_9BACT|nr:glycosyltransferase family 87 protein [Dyadobacter pollutisoli]WAC14779.1 glycosyltransferase family 87 protein [Dyadobacter pollutisoli]